MVIRSFTPADIPAAQWLALDNYLEERLSLAALPALYETPALDELAGNGLGVAAYEESGMVGFLCSCSPWEGAFGSTARGTYSPIHAHGAVKENREKIYRHLYQAAAEKWVAQKIAYHAIGLYAHDREAVEGFFTSGFGLRCLDAIRPMLPLAAPGPEGISFYELPRERLPAI